MLCPTPIAHAALMLTDTWYQHRSPVTPGSVAQVPYTYDLAEAVYAVERRRVNPHL